MSHILQNRSVLLVDDSPDNRLLLSIQLRVLGIEVACAETGLQAITMTQENGFDAILMDIQMPVMDGLEATRTLRAQGIQIPIIAVTAHALTHHRSQSLAAGCNEHLTKPVPLGVLQEALCRHLSSRGSFKPSL